MSSRPDPIPFGRVQRLRSQIRQAGVAGSWEPGTSAGPGRRFGTARMNLLYGPDGFVIVVARPDARASMRQLRAAGARRPVVMQSVRNGEETLEIVRMNVSDFLDLLESHTLRLAQEGRLKSDE